MVDDTAVDHAVVETGEAPAVAGKGLGVGDSRRTTTRYMTKYEKARILGTRALQIR